MCTNFHSIPLQEDASKAALRESEAHKEAEVAAARWDTTRQSLEERVSSLQARVTHAAQTAEGMYVAICRPAAGSAAGLGIVLGAAAEGGRYPQVADLVQGGPAAGKIKACDVILAVNGAATQDVPLEQVEAMMAGKVGAQVKLRAQAPGSKKPYEVVLTRVLSTEEDRLDTLTASLLPEAVACSDRLYEELEKLREQVPADKDSLSE
jgi:C-terminal processing protease CtpA/Prc